MQEYLLSLSHVSVSLQKRVILKDIHFAIKRGEIVCVLGANGSGKSTLLQTILGLVPFSGEIMLQGRNIQSLSYRQRAKMLSYVPQNCVVNFPYSAIEVAMMGRFCHSPLYHTQHDRLMTMHIFENLGIQDLAHLEFSTLSGGQKQLVLIARALTQESEMIILDEPVSALDMAYSSRVLEVLRSLNKSIILSSHHPQQCFIAHKIALLLQGELLCFDEPKKALQSHFIDKLYHIRTQSVALPDGAIYFYPLHTSAFQNLDSKKQG